MDSQISQPELTPRERKRIRALYWGLIAVCFVIAGVGWYLTQWQNKPLQDWIPVQATIGRITDIVQKDGSGHTTKRPLILYSYTVDGVVYTTDRVVAPTDARDGTAASTFVGQIHEGQVITAYHNPIDPGSAYLVRQRSRLLYVYSLGPLLLAIALIVNWPRVARV